MTGTTLVTADVVDIMRQVLMFLVLEETVGVLLFHRNWPARSLHVLFVGWLSALEWMVCPRLGVNIY
jgi:hypothetical protein